MTKKEGVDSARSLETDKGVKSTVKGEIPCVLVFPDRKHVDYVHYIISHIEGLLSPGFNISKLTDDTLPDDHFGKTIEELVEQCVLGIVILDGFKPNVLYEYGLLRGKDKLVIPIQDKKAVVAVKSFYSLPKDSLEAIIKDRTGLTRTQFERLKQPPCWLFPTSIRPSRYKRHHNRLWRRIRFS